MLRRQQGAVGVDAGRCKLKCVVNQTDLSSCLLAGTRGRAGGQDPQQRVGQPVHCQRSGGLQPGAGVGRVPCAGRMQTHNLNPRRQTHASRRAGVYNPLLPLTCFWCRWDAIPRRSVKPHSCCCRWDTLLKPHSLNPELASDRGPKSGAAHGLIFVCNQNSGPQMSSFSPRGAGVGCVAGAREKQAFRCKPAWAHGNQARCS